MSDVLPNCTPPARALPALACDSHAHVFGPYDRFPLGEARSYTPPEATAEAHQAMLNTLGFERAVLVQPSAYGDDHACIVDAVSRAPSARRAIGVMGGEATSDQLGALQQAGVSGLRFVELISTRYAGRPKGASGFAELFALAPIMREQGLHAQLFAKTETFAEHWPALLATGVPLVLDHMAAAGPSGISLGDPEFEALLALLREGRVWVKLPVIRRSNAAPDYADARPMHDAFLRANPDRLLWGTDWPLVNMANKPDPGRLLDLLDEWTNDDALRSKILVDNPAALYRFE